MREIERLKGQIDALERGNIGGGANVILDGASKNRPIQLTNQNSTIYNNANVINQQQAPLVIKVDMELKNIMGFSV
jgi:hypothetical protein